MKIPLLPLLIGLVLPAARSSAGDFVYLYNGPGGGQADYVTRNVPLNGATHYSLDPGAGFSVPFELGLTLSPAEHYTGPEFFGGLRLVNTASASRLTASAEQTQRINNNQADDPITFQIATESTTSPVAGRYQLVVIFPLPPRTVPGGLVVEYVRAKGQRPGGDHLRFLVGDGTRWLASAVVDPAEPAGLRGRFELTDLSRSTWHVADLRAFAVGETAELKPAACRFVGLFFEGEFEAPRANGIVESIGIASFAYRPVGATR